MRTPRPMTVMLLFLATIAATACGIDSTTSTGGPSSPRLRPVPRASTLTSTTFLFNQLFFGNEGTCLPSFGRLATDFAVPAGERWIVQGLVVQDDAGPGTFDPGSTPYSLRRDNAGVPGSTVIALGRPGGTGFESFGRQVTLIPTIALTEGRYWLVTDFTQATGSVMCWTRIESARLGTDFLKSSDNGLTWTDPLPNEESDLAFAVLGYIETPATATEGLQELVTKLPLDAGLLNSFQVKIRAALEAIAAGDTATACVALQDFINQVSAQAGKKIPAVDATALLTEASRIRGLLGC